MEVIDEDYKCEEIVSDNNLNNEFDDERTTIKNVVFTK